MPIFVGYTQKRRTIRIVTAGETQFLLCPDTDIFLTAQITDLTNLKNHTLKWVQTKGPPVILSADDQLTVSFPFADTEDKEFRFYLDYGTNKEQYKDVQLYYTPTTNAGPSVKSTNQDTWEATMPNLVRTSSFIIPDPTEEVQGDVRVGPAIRYTFDLTTLSGLVGNQDGMDIFSDENYVTNPSTLYASYSAQDFPTSLVLPNGVYIVRVYYLVGGNRIQVDSPLLVSQSSIPGGIRVTQDIYKNVNIAKAATDGILRFVIRTEQAQENYGPIAHNMPELVKSVVVHRRIPTTIGPSDYPALNVNFSMSAGPRSLAALVRLDQGNIGND